MLHKIKLLNDFDWRYYLSEYPDLQEAYSTEEEAVEHYLNHGYKEGRDFNNMSSLSIVVVCKNRLDNLLRCLNSWLDINDKIQEYIVVDYSSDVPLIENMIIQDWVNSRKIKLIRVDNETKFNLGQAYNLAIDHCRTRFIMKIDSDYICTDPSFINHLNKQGLMKNFICGDFNFCQDESMNGFVIFPNASPAFYKEDLNGWGYDDIQFYKDLENRADLHKNSFFNIENHIKHIYHRVTKNTSLEKANKELCKVKNRNQIRRNYSNSPKGIIYDHSNPIERIFCINLDQRTDRWNYINKFDYKNLTIERLPAIESQSAEPHLKYNPINLDSELYFHLHPNGFGTYLSHYKIWQKIVEQKISHALIIEDDIDIKSLYNLFDSNIIFDDSIDLYNLSKRVRQVENDFVVFDGAESYVLTYKGAELLLEITRHPSLINKVNIPTYNSNITELTSNYNIKSYKIPDYESSVIAPVDKFIGMCCASDLLQDHYYLYPFIDLNEKVSDQSDISHKNTESWLLNKEDTLELANKLNAIVSTKTS